MSQVKYGTGRNTITIDVVATKDLTFQPVYDDAKNYVATKVTLRVMGVLNPSLNAYSRDVANNAAAVRTVPATIQPGGPGGSLTGGVMGPDTLSAIKDALARPRQRLVFTNGNVVVFESQVPGVPCDCMGGPFLIEAPQVSGSIGFVGIKTVLVSVGWETWIHPSRGNFAGHNNNQRVISPLISHTYEIQETVDQDYYSSRLITGRALFRRDRLDALNASPDSFRAWFLHPIPSSSSNWKRDKIHVIVASNGNEARYQVLDKEAYTVATHRDITRMEGIHHVDASKPSVESAAAATISLPFDILGGIFGRGRNNGFGSRASTAIGHLRPAAIGSWLSGITPQVNHHIVVRCWGLPTATHGTLSTAAHRIMASRIYWLNLLWWAGSITETRDLAGSFVEVTGTFHSSITQYLFGSTPYNRIPDFGQFFPSTIVVPGVRDLYSANPGTVKVAPNWSGTRGDWLGEMIAQTLQDVGDPSPQPSSVRVAAQQTP